VYNNSGLDEGSGIELNLTLTDIFANKRCLQKNHCLRKRKNQCFSNKKCKLVTKTKLNKRNKNIRISMDDTRGFFIWKSTKLVNQILKNIKNVFFSGVYGLNKYLLVSLLKHQYLVQFFFKIKTKKFLKDDNNKNIIKKNKNLILLSNIQYLFSPLIKPQNIIKKAPKNKLLYTYKKLYTQYKLDIQLDNNKIKNLIINFINQISYK
jgi:hypothetical protein